MDLATFTHFLNGFLMIAMPVGLAILLARRWKGGWRIWLIGAATLILSQVGHYPFNLGAGWLLNRTRLVYWPEPAQLIFNAVFLGLSAGVFEETARYLVLRYWIKEARSWRKGILFGAGHGGVEAIILGAVVLYYFFQAVALRNADLSTLFSGTQITTAQQQVATYWSAPWYYNLLGALERFFTIPCQIAMAVMVMQVFTRKRIGWLFLAIAYHALLDSTAVLSGRYLGVYWIEAIIGGFAILSLILIFVLKQPEPAADPSVTASGQPLEPAPTPFSPKPVEETIENLDKSRYE